MYCNRDLPERCFLHFVPRYGLQGPQKVAQPFRPGGLAQIFGHGAFGQQGGQGVGLLAGVGGA